jgi:molybdopterin molybdotransferase
MAVDKERGFKVLSSVDESLGKIMDRIEPVDTEVIRTFDGIGRVLREDIVSEVDSPPFDRSAMDGYAVNSRYVSGASPNNPIRLRIVGESKTADPYEGVIGPYEAVRIDTGAPMPKGADAVVMVEDTVRVGDYIEVYSAVSPYQNVSIKGEDVRRGDTVVYRGMPLTPMDVATLLSLGIDEIRVYRRVRISIASIGNELLEYNTPIKEGYIRETNRLLVGGILSEFPIEIVRSIILPDDYDAIKEFIDMSMEDSDLIITTGGTSLGVGDLVTDIAGELGEVLVHGVALQPSKPVLISVVDSKPYIGLPGYPVAAAISTEVFLIPIVCRLAGIDARYMDNYIDARLMRRVASRLGFRHYVRVKLLYKDGEWYADPIYASGAGVLSSLSRSDGYLIIPENSEGLEEGSIVRVKLFRRFVRL